MTTALHSPWRLPVVGLIVVALLAAGIVRFQKGFLLTRVSVPSKSTCADFDGGSASADRSATYSKGAKGCWMPKPHPGIQRAVLVLIDALRFDFAQWDSALFKDDGTIIPEQQHYRNKLSVFHNHTNGFSQLYRFVADPPSTTLQRLKALTTGSLPTFVEMSDNFGSGEIHEDSIIYQLTHAPRNGQSDSESGAARKVTFMGDDTWMGLFPRYLNKAWPFPSFDVWDLHTVDNGILSHIFQEVRRDDWDVIVAHFLGVDHAGHRHGPSHPSMGAKLRQLNRVLFSLTEQLPEDTVLMVMGDHGMDAKGDHGGDSQLELESALWIYSKSNIFTRDPPNDDSFTPTIDQIDFVPTLSLLLGIPIPMENLGAVIPEVFPDVNAALKVNARQVKRYLEAYAKLSPDLRDYLPKLMEIKDERRFLKETLRVCRAVWAQFDLPAMLIGIVLVVCSIVGVLAFNPSQASKGMLIGALTAAIYFSDSFVLYEDALVFFVLQSVLVFAAAHATTSESLFRLGLTLIFNLVAFQITVCRDEQSNCFNTFHHPGALTGAALAILLYLTCFSRLSSNCSRWCGLLLISYWIISEEIVHAPRWIPVWIARVQMLSSLAFALPPLTLLSAQKRLLLGLCFLCQLHRPVGMLAIFSIFWFLVTNLHDPNLERREAKLPISSGTLVALLHLYLRFAYFATGHQATLSSIQWSVGHTGLWTTDFVLSPIYVALNLIGHVLLVFLAIAWLPRTTSTAGKIIWGVALLEMVHVAVSCIAALILRRHLMVWGVFAPRWMLACLLGVTVGFLAAIASILTTSFASRPAKLEAKR